MRRPRFVLWAAVFQLGTCFVAHRIVHAQSTATISGIVTDPSNASVAGAEITARSLDASGTFGLTLRTRSSADGSFSITVDREFSVAAAEKGTWEARLELEKMPSSVVVAAGAQPAPAATTPDPVDIAGYYVGRQTDSDFDGLGIASDPSFVRWDLSNSVDLGHGLSTVARFQNLFDCHYQEAVGYPALGYNYRLGLRYAWGGER